MRILAGSAVKVGDHVDTDAIIPARYCTAFDPETLGAHTLEGELEIPVESLRGSILVAGLNFGCGSAREHAAIAIQGAGVLAVVAQSFSRTFFRNAINIALPVFEISGASEIQNGDLVEIDPDQMVVLNQTNGKQYPLPSYPPMIKQIMEAGGMIEFARNRLAERRLNRKD
jgi:3-isopropylmalate/(R)-2-methylmalate dehydratase small subunit